MCVERDMNMYLFLNKHLDVSNRCMYDDVHAKFQSDRYTPVYAYIYDILHKEIYTETYEL